MTDQALPGRWLDRWGNQAVTFIEDHQAGALALITLIYGILCWAISATKLMWFDELATHYPATLPAVADVIRFFFDGLDVHTPVSALMERSSLALFGDTSLARRGPYILGYWLMCVSLYRFVAHRAGVIWGLVAMTFPLIASTFYYATEMRPYALVMGLSAFAAACWQMAAIEGKHRMALIPLTWFSLVLMVSLHYYAVFTLIPFGIAELVRWHQRRRIDWAMWIAIGTAPLVLILFLPAIQNARPVYLGGIWARPSPSSIENSYRFLLTLAFPPICGSLILWMIAGLRQKLPGGVEQTTPVAERALIASWALLPFFVVPLSYFSGAYVERYSLPAFAGIVLYLTMLAWRRSSGDKVIALLVASVFLAWFVLKAPATVRRQMGETNGYPFRTSEPFAAKPWMTALAEGELPVVTCPAVFFLQIQHYAPANVRPRLRYLASRSYAKELEGMDTGDANLTQFVRMLPLQVVPYDEFLRDHSRFLLLADTTNLTWQLEKLRMQGAQLKLLRRHGAVFLFDVVLP